VSTPQRARGAFDDEDEDGDGDFIREGEFELVRTSV
jgi:hypothetical protein